MAAIFLRPLVEPGSGVLLVVRGPAGGGFSRKVCFLRAMMAPPMRRIRARLIKNLMFIAVECQVVLPFKNDPPAEIFLAIFYWDR